MSLRCHTERWNRQFEILVLDSGEVWAGDKNSGRNHLLSTSPKSKPSGSQSPPTEATHKRYLKLPSPCFCSYSFPLPRFFCPVIISRTL